MIRALLADDQELVRDGFRMILDFQDDITVVGGADALDQLASRDVLEQESAGAGLHCLVDVGVEVEGR